MTAQEAFEQEGWIPVGSDVKFESFPHIQTLNWSGRVGPGAGDTVVLIAKVPFSEIEAYGCRTGLHPFGSDLRTPYWYKAVAE